jgi:pimeloyl-ACP methyl ester carboxylesterase
VLRNATRRPVRSTLSLIAASALVLLPLSPAAADANPEGVSAVQAKDRDWYKAQRVTWEECPGGTLQCATIQVPLKWAKPTGAKISIALARKKATKQPAPKGVIVINPGGPGASGIESLDALSAVFGSKVRANYDIVAFDPRGVGASSAVTCTTTTNQMHRHLAEWFPSNEEGRVAAKKAARDWGKKCRELTGPLLGQVDTVSAARDMDVIRAALSQRKLNYFGWSYGSKLGSTYAELFPGRVGRTVLDGAINPAQDANAASNSQLVGFENSLRAWAENCVALGGCAVGATVEAAMTAVHDLIEACETNPLPTGTKGRPLTASLAFTGVILALYDDSYWPLLTLAVGNAVNGQDASVLLMLADAYNGFDGLRYANNMLQANIAINCLDYPSADATQAQVDEQIARAVAEAPTLGEFWVGNGIAQCAHWPYKASGTPRPAKSSTKARILVIGTTGDPATPFTNAVELTKQLKTARLLTLQGEGHTAYGRGNTCINKAVDRYLLTGKLPAKGRVCK